MATIQQMHRTESGSYNLGGDMAADLGLSEATAEEALAALQDAEPDAAWTVAEGYLGWGLVAVNASGDTLSITD